MTQQVKSLCVPERNSQHTSKGNTRMFFGSAVCNIKMKQIGNRPNAHQRQDVLISEQGCMKSLLQKDMYRATKLS